MTPDEQRMIQDLFQRLSAQGRVAKDAQAERVINDGLRANPDAGYQLVQTALVYEYQMNEQELRIRELEDQIAGLQRGQAAAPAGGGSFLGGRIGAGRGGSVPGVAAQQASPWQSAPQQPAAYQQPAPQRGGMFGGGAPAPMQPQAAPAGGGFFRSALTTAAGVAGGMMVANSLSGLFGGGNNAHAAGHTPAAADNSGVLADADATQDELQDAQYQPEDTSAATDLSGWDDVET
jgi:uncharacterized protein